MVVGAQQLNSSRGEAAPPIDSNSVLDVLRSDFVEVVTSQSS
jgi:hypothetical protein